MEEDQP